MKILSALFLGLSTVSLAFCSTAANAQTSIDFTAAIANVCTVAALTPGAMSYDPTEHDKLGEEAPGTFTVFNTDPGGTVTIAPPSDFTIRPGTYNGSPTFSYRYSFVGVNTIENTVGVSSPTGSSETLALLGLNTGTLYSSAVTTGGDFTTGAYTATYTVTCS